MSADFRRSQVYVLVAVRVAVSAMLSSFQLPSLGVVKFTDRICCVGGISGSNQFDTLVVVDIEREFQTLLTGSTADLLPEDVKPEVLERVIAVATELAVEGREGRPVGCLFVVGDTERVRNVPLSHGSPPPDGSAGAGTFHRTLHRS